MWKFRKHFYINACYYFYINTCYYLYSRCCVHLSIVSDIKVICLSIDTGIFQVVAYLCIYPNVVIRHCEDCDGGLRSGIVEDVDGGCDRTLRRIVIDIADVDSQLK